MHGITRAVNAAATDTSVRAVRLVCVLGLSLLAGCTHSTAGPNPYAAQIQTARHDATSPFERSVLSDGKITKSEYDQAVALYVRCVRSRGVNMSAQLAPPLDAYYEYVVSPPRSTDQSVMNACGRGTTDLVGDLYVQLVENPQKVDLDTLTVRCLIRRGVVPATYTRADWERDQANDLRGAPFRPDDPKIATSFDACMEAPSK